MAWNCNSYVILLSSYVCLLILLYYIFSSFCLVFQEAHAMQVKVSAQYKNEIDMAKAQRDYELKKAAYDIEVNTKKAESEMAYQLQVHTLEKNNN